MTTLMKRRTFVTAIAASAASYRRIYGANERIGVGLIGCGKQGRLDWARFIEQPDVEPVAVSEVYQPHMDLGLQLAKGRAKPYPDFRRLLERKEVDAVAVVTPDHWHAMATVLCCQAGKDVYVEKPLSHNLAEGRAMVSAARKYGRVVQTGMQQRSGTHYARAAELIRGGHIGKVVHISAGLLRNAMPGYGNPPDAPPPKELDWDMWLGPAPWHAYNPLRCIYNFRWFFDYSSGTLGNWGIHNLDIMRFVMNVKGPTAVAGFGQRLALTGGDVPDVQEVIYRFPDFLVSYSVRECNGSRKDFLEFHGTNGNLVIDRGGFKITAEQWTKDGKAVPVMEDSSSPGSPLDSVHIRNFLNCVKTRQRPIADVEEGHLSAVLCHLGNISTTLGRSLLWDSEKEQVTGDAEANRCLFREYRAPWKLAV